MIEAAGRSFDLDVPGKDGFTPRKHLLQAYKMTGKMPRRLAAAEIPAWGAYLLDMFYDLASGRGSTGWGPAAITWGDMASWVRLRGLHIDAWEVDILRRLDQAWLHAHYSKD